MAKGNSKIENVIDEIEAEIQNSKSVFLSATQISVNREAIEVLIKDLRNCIPEELERCRKIISNREAIERQAREDAEKIRNDMKEQMEQIVSESEIMAQAKARADEMVALAAEEAEQIREDAWNERQMYLSSAQNYLNDMLLNLNDMIGECIDATTRNTQKFMDSLNSIGQTVQEDLFSLNNPNEDPTMAQPQVAVQQIQPIEAATEEPKSIFENEETAENAEDEG
jgi:dsDNA-specific endonuclease/ATPase MutS2